MYFLLKFGLLARECFQWQIINVMYCFVDLALCVDLDAFIHYFNRPLSDMEHWLYYLFDLFVCLCKSFIIYLGSIDSFISNM